MCLRVRFAGRSWRPVTREGGNSWLQSGGGLNEAVVAVRQYVCSSGRRRVPSWFIHGHLLRGIQSLSPLGTHVNDSSGPAFTSHRFTSYALKPSFYFCILPELWKGIFPRILSLLPTIQKYTFVILDIFKLP